MNQKTAQKSLRMQMINQEIAKKLIIFMLIKKIKEKKMNLIIIESTKVK
jgi:hypothetical protein